MTDKERIEAILAHFNWKSTQLANYIDVSTQNIYDILREKNNISKQMAKKIKEKIPQINHSWLLGISDQMWDSETEKSEKIEPQQETATLQSMLSLMEKLVDGIQKNADANLINARANEENSRSMAKLVDMVSEKQQTYKKEQDIHTSDVKSEIAKSLYD